ncbi:MAG: sialate O-acetylesterase [Rikenellaceae bacterium]
MKIGFLATLCLMALGAYTSEAKVTLPSIIADDMVLQRNTEVRFWGESTAEGKIVTIAPSWSKAKYKAAVSGGKWSVKLPTTDAGGPYTVTISDGDKLTLSNILLGDVWICMGQSNMQMPMSGFGFKEQRIAGNTQKNQPVEGSAKVITQAKESTPIRMYTMEFNPQNRPQESVEGRWETNTPEAVHAFSAAGYFFGRDLQSALDIPIGLLSVNRGSSAIETWMSREWLESTGYEYNFSILESEKIPNNVVMQPCYLYNGMLAPIEGLSIKGGIWYQGESNRVRPEMYLKQFPAFVAGLRDHFDGGDFPFYFAQIAPWRGEMAESDLSGAYMRETMEKLIDLTPRTAMVALTDIGEDQIIHPRYKREVGERFAIVALSEEYGVEGIHYRTPEFASLKPMVDPVGKKIQGVGVAFDHCPTGIISKDRSSESTQFEIAGDDRVFYPAKAILIKNAYPYVIWVGCEEVEEPVAVRYAYKNYAEGDLYNAFGLALSSFRSDDWDLSAPAK